MNDIRTLLAWAKENNIGRIEWTIYYNNDENHIDTIYAYPIDDSPPKIDMEDYFPEGISELDIDVGSIGWDISAALEDGSGDTGIFILDVKSRKIAKIANAYMPEPELEIETIYDPAWMTVAQFEKA